jgi:predicted nuclease with RNAse H fold
VSESRCWAGVDVGGRRKGFHLALVDDRRLVAPVKSAATVSAVVAELSAAQPAVVAIDSPSALARDDARSRDCEKELAGRICGIRYTPDRETVYSDHRTGYYDWIKHGLQLYDALRSGGNWHVHVIETFPTASISRWGGA